MFRFSIKEKDFLNDFYDLFSVYVNKSYQYTMRFIADPNLTQIRERERLILISLNKAVYQGVFSFIKLNNSNMQYAAFSSLEGAVYAMRLYSVLSQSTDAMQSYITQPDFSLEAFESAEDEKQGESYQEGTEEFSLKEFCNGLHKLNTFELKNASISSQVCNGNVYLGLSCGEELSSELQDEIRKNVIGAYLSLFKHNKLFGSDSEENTLKEMEDDLFSKFLEYLKKNFS